VDLPFCGCLQRPLHFGILIKAAEFKSFQTDRFGCNNSHNYLIDNKIGRFIIQYIILVIGYWLLPFTTYLLPIASHQSPVISQLD